MKKTFLLFLLFFYLFPNSINAASTNKRIYPYEITNVNINDTDIWIEGWGMVVEKHHFNSTNTHYYTLELKANNHTLTYTSNPIYNSQTNTMKVTNTKRCKNNEYNKEKTTCYYDYDYVGFMFKIPLKDLQKDKVYNTKFVVNSKILNFKQSTDIFYPMISPLVKQIGKIEYQVVSNLYDTQLRIAETSIYDRESPSKNSKKRKANVYCSSKYGYNRYFEEDTIYNKIYDRKKSESTTYYKVKTDKKSICRYNHNMIYEGSDYDSWIASNWVDFSGNPLQIITKDKNHKPTITILNHPTILNDQISSFNFKNFIYSYDEDDGILTDKTIITNKVDLSVLGSHSLNLEVLDSDGAKAYETLNVNVIKGNTPPNLYAYDNEIYQYETFDPLKHVSAYDQEDGNLTNKITYDGYVNTTQLGKYQITYYVKDSKNESTSKSIWITVIRNPKEKIRYISNKETLIFYKQQIPINWINKYDYLKDQIQNPMIFSYKKIEY